MLRWLVGWAAVASLVPQAGMAADGAPIVFEQTCDASGAVFTLDGALLVADERTDELHTYAVTGGAPLASIDLYGLTGTPRNARRNYSAFEGAARLGDKVYFVTSHARESKGKNRPNRRRLLAVESRRVGEAEQFEPIGLAYTNLHVDLSSRPELRSLGLAGSVMHLHRELAHLAPDQRGLAIEGLAAGRDGSLLVGLRNPRPLSRAIVIPILNPERVVIGLAGPEFGVPSRLDLGGLGIASMALAPSQNTYAIVAAPHDRAGSNVLFRWSGEPADAPVRVGPITPEDFDAQAMAVSPDGKRLLLLSDDGERPVPVGSREECQRPPGPDGTCPCGLLTDPARKHFRGQWVDLPPAPAPPVVSEKP
jgi:hypothetical protein